MATTANIVGPGGQLYADAKHTPDEEAFSGEQHQPSLLQLSVLSVAGRGIMERRALSGSPDAPRPDRLSALV